MSTGTSTVDWQVRWEDDLAPAEHEAIARLLARAFPDQATVFTAGRSWFSARPQVRVLGLVDGAPAAHLGVLPRLVRAGAARVLVGECGLVSVAPQLRGTGAGAALLARTAELLDDLAVSFGLLTCQPHVVGFYEKAGWHRVEGQRTRMLGRRGRVTVFAGPSLVLPVRGDLAAWPGGLIDRDGYEV